MNFTRLRLVSPLYYRPFAGLSSGLFAKTLDRGEGGGETLFWFEINPAQVFSIEPEGGAYLGTLIAAGCAVPGTENAAGAARSTAMLVLPAGDYFFTQIRDEAGELQDTGGGELAALCTEMAVELQKEGLWERLKLGKSVYFRILWEDGARVFQALRPFTA